MNIENSDQVIRLCKESGELDKAVCLLSGGGYLRVYGTGQNFAEIRDKDLKEKVEALLKERQKVIKEQLKPL